MNKTIEETKYLGKETIETTMNEVYNEMFTKKVNILGTEYTIYTNVNEYDDIRIKEFYGVCDYSTKEIFISKDTQEADEQSMKNLKDFENKVIRHEIIHAFLYESGLRENSNRQIAWAENEEMVDWIAIQFPKILKVYKELDIL